MDYTLILTVIFACLGSFILGVRARPFIEEIQHATNKYRRKSDDRSAEEVRRSYESAIRDSYGNGIHSKPVTPKGSKAVHKTRPDVVLKSNQYSSEVLQEVLD